MGLKNLIILGGQIESISIEGEIELWKNVQKKEMKKNNSEIINIIILNFNILIMNKECIPWKVLSRTISRNQKIIEDVRMNIFEIIIKKLFK